MVLLLALFGYDRLPISLTVSSLSRLGWGATTQRRRQLLLYGIITAFFAPILWLVLRVNSVEFCCGLMTFERHFFGKVWLVWFNIWQFWSKRFTLLAVYLNCRLLLRLHLKLKLEILSHHSFRKRTWRCTSIVHEVSDPLDRNFLNARILFLTVMQFQLRCWFYLGHNDDPALGMFRTVFAGVGEYVLEKTLLAVDLAHILLGALFAYITHHTS